jgi:four helix bundle protein
MPTPSAMTEQVLKERTKEFARRTIRLVDALPDTISGCVLARQVMRSGTSVAANYRALCRSKSAADFINKTSVIEEEADETALWLELISETGKLPAKKVDPLLKEANELTAIFVASRRTAQKNRESKIENRK